MRSTISFILFMVVSTSIFANPNEFSLANALALKKKKTESKIDKSRLLIGPGIGLGAFQRAFSFNINPSLGYAFTNNFTAGIGLGFSYFQQSFDYTNTVTNKQTVFRYKIPTYTVGMFARYMIANMFIIGVEPEISNTKFYTGEDLSNLTTGVYKEGSRRLTVPSFLVGGGYGQRISNYGYYYFMGMYDLVQNQNARAYYETIAIRIGVMLPLYGR